MQGQLLLDHYDRSRELFVAATVLCDNLAVSQVDRAVARFFYGTGCSFNRLASPYFDEMLAAVAKYGPGYRKPNVNALRTTLLTEEVQSVQKQLAETVLETLPKTGCTVASDGWSSTDNRPLLNVLLVSPKGACFATAIDTSGQTKVRPSLSAD